MKKKYFVRPVTIFITIMIVVFSPFVLKEALAAERGRIVFVSADSGRWELYIIDNVRDAAPQQLTDSAHDKRTPRWSPDGSKIAYAAMQGDLYIVDAASREIQVLQLPSIRNAEAAWSPDGTALVYVSYTQPREFKTELWIAEFEERGVQAGSLLIPEGLKTFPAWLSDGQGIVYTRFIKHGPSGPVEDICSFDLTVEQEKTLISNGFDNMQAAWSPDGQWLAYASNQGGNYDIWLWRPDRAEPRQITRDPAMDTDPAWSPDGGEIAFVSSRTGLSQIWVVDVVSGLERQLTFSEKGSRDPAWSGTVPTKDTKDTK
ncbi:MAG: hypothetical protein GY794_25720 [bacterium]|nr:hypothetical protein [bacterium]